MTGEHAVKRLEFRAKDIHLEGKSFPLETYSNIFITILFALLVGFSLDRRIRYEKTDF